MKSTRQLVIKGAVLTVASLVSSLAAAGDATVVLDMRAFNPPQLTVAAGTNVVFQNNDTTAHQVASTDGDIFQLKLQKPGESGAHVFGKSGTYTINCTLHPHMKMTVIVE